MRIELELIQKIEAYLMGTLSPNDKAGFESEMNQNAELQKNIELQKSIMEGIQRLALKTSAQNAHAGYKLQAFLTKLVVIAVIVSAIIILTIYTWPKETTTDPPVIHTSAEPVSEILLDENDSLWCEANQYLAQELFEISQVRDTVIESKDGIVVYIPANAFETPNQKIDFIIQSALTPQDIMYSGLSTLTEDRDTLETGGMFYFDAFVNGERVALRNELTVDIPADPSKQEMKLYDGVKNASGELLWNNPKEFTNPLTPVDILSLDFYPPGYEAKMNEWGYSYKPFKDSMYYSFAHSCDNATSKESSTHAGEIPPVNQPGNSNFENRPAVQAPLIPLMMFLPFPQDSADLITYATQDNSSSNTRLTDQLCIGVDPASVQTIWNKKFNGTNLATKEFEARMPWIHKTCNNDVLELYIHHLDKNLSTVDSMVMKIVGGSLKKKFAEFAAMNQGSVEITSDAQKALNAYYDKKRKALQLAVETTLINHEKAQLALDAEFADKTKNSEKRNDYMKNETFRQELEFNTTKVYADLGMKKPNQRISTPITWSGQAGPSAPFDSQVNVAQATPINPNRPILRANIGDLGWKNVDCLFSVTSSREDVSIRGNNRTTSLSYSDWSATIEKAEEYDKANVYIIPEGFNSYVKINITKGGYKFSLNDGLNYQVVIIAWNEEGIYYHQSSAVAGTTTIPLQKITKQEWEGKIKSSFTGLNTMQQEMDYAEYAQKDIGRQNERAFKEELRAKIFGIVFPCMVEADTLASGAQHVPIDAIEE